MTRLYKYPRTHHLRGSRLQPGDEDLAAVAYGELAGSHLVIEEKLDGANAGVSFDDGGALRLQSRGHYLTGGRRERHFDLFKTWAARHAGALYERLGARYVMYGEWVYAKHTIFYDRLPHYFLEFDVFDTDTGAFLSTARRRALLDGSPVVSVPVLHDGPAPRRDALLALIGPSLYKSARWRERLADVAAAEALDATRVRDETDPEDAMEGLYVKVEAEADGRVAARYKFIRPSFLTAVVDSGTHWLNRPIVPNQLRDDVDLFGEPT